MVRWGKYGTFSSFRILCNDSAHLCTSLHSIHLYSTHGQAQSCNGIHLHAATISYHILAQRGNCDECNCDDGNCDAGWVADGLCKSTRFCWRSWATSDVSIEEHCQLCSSKVLLSYNKVTTPLSQGPGCEHGTGSGWDEPSITRPMAMLTWYSNQKNPAQTCLDPVSLLHPVLQAW